MSNPGKTNHHPSPPGMKCTRCKGPAQHRFPSHNLRLCSPCLEVFVRRQAERAIKKFQMLQPGQKVVCAISGGKDSLVLWKVLADLGYETRGLHFSLDFGEFSEKSIAASEEMARRLGLPLKVVSFEQMAGHTVQEVVWANRRDFCSVCGTLKRHFMNRACLELGATVLATGHHLDDEAGRLLGNMIHRHHQYMERQWPVLEGMGGGMGGGIGGGIGGGVGGLVKKVKPLCRLSGREIKAYAKSLELPAQYDSCPNSRGATLPYYQEAMAFLEEKMPGTKRNFYLGFLREKGAPPPPPVPEGVCDTCGAPSHAFTCTACRLLAHTKTWLAEKAAQAASADQAAPGPRDQDLS